MVWYLFLFISCHSLCLLGITDIFFISKHHAGMPTWQTSGEAVLSGAIIQPWQLLHSWAYCQNTSAQEGRPEGGLERQTWVWLGLYCVREGGGVEASGASEFWLSYLSSWAQAHPSLSCFVCTNMIVCSQADCYIHVYTHTSTRARTYTQTNTRVPWLSLCVTLHTWPTGLLWLSARDESLNKSGMTLTSKYTCFLSFPNSRKVSTLS